VSEDAAAVTETLAGHDEQDALGAALALAGWGLAVFPLKPNSKEPATPHGFKDASRSPAVIRSWWEANPRYGVAVATGHGLAVLDVDTVEGHGKDGPATLAALEREHGELPRTPESLTTTGGRHLWFLAPRMGTSPNLAPGLDLKASGGYVVAPPTALNGGTYRWDLGADPTEIPRARIPDWLLGLRDGHGAGSGSIPRTDRTPAAADAYRSFTDRLLAVGSWTRDDHKWACPAHHDRNPSLSVDVTPDGTILLRCFAGCTTQEIMAALRRPMSDLFTEPNTPRNTEADARPHPIDVNELAVRRSSPQTFVVNDLITRGGVIELAGEEGEGKTMLAEQIVRQVIRGEDVAGFFEVSDGTIRRAVFLDTEMEETDGEARSRDFDARGLQVPDGTMFWLSYSEINLSDSAEDQTYLLEQLQTIGAEFLWIDTGGNAVSDPKDDVYVRAFFNYLSRLKREAGVAAVGLSLQPRKRAQGEYSRRFDDLFGSREWKGRPWKALYIDGGKVTCWKDRGGHIRRRWPARSGKYAAATLLRPGMKDPTSVPFQIEATEPEVPIDEDAVKAQALAIVSAEPDTYTKNALARKLGVRMAEAVRLVNELLAARAIGPDKERAKLSLMHSQTLEGL
jgi:Bifunctional DNA primase/polymerase, N-terminal/AAA domain